MAALRLLCKIAPANCIKLCRFYTIQPPEWLGGVNRLTAPNRHEFPEHEKTFQQKMAELHKDAAQSRPPVENIGSVLSTPVRDRSKHITVANANRRNKDMEQAARLRKLKIPLDDVKKEWLIESAAQKVPLLAEHYGIYGDLFGGNLFVPVVNMNVSFDYDAEFVTPVYYGNKIPAAEARQQPNVDYVADSNSLWTLLLTNPDGHLTDSNKECVHWLIGNIPGCDLKRGEVLVDYIQPYPVKGTGFHRFVFILFEQKQMIDYSKCKRDLPCNALTKRTHSTLEFFTDHRDSLTPKGLAFFQSEWDASVRAVFHKVFGIGEPVYEYIHPVPYHPPPKKYPHKEPFDRYFDRYRHKKDLAEEVMRLKLSQISPFQKPQQVDKYPLIHREKKYKPSWLKIREELMHRRLEQYKDLA